MTQDPELKAAKGNDLRRIGFFFIDGFAMMSASSAVEPLRAANLLSGKQLYDVKFFSKGGGQAISSCGAMFETEPLKNAANRIDILFVVAGGNPMSFDDEEVIERLRRFGVHGLPLGGISSGAVLLAKAGTLRNRRFTVHWEHFEELRTLSGDFLIERRLFVMDRDRYTCAGGVAPLDMMHALIRSSHGAELACAVSDWFIHTGIRAANAPQKSGYAGHDKQLHPKVLTALELMENHLADPLSLNQIAMLSGIGPRQLQRRFDEDFGKGVMQCYMDLRLQKADELVHKTRLPLMEVAMTTGFVNQGHFAKSYRSKFALSPSERRNKQTG
ncbi:MULTISPECIES: GlxA family transcriptional regulator [unclassified Roseibium]|uniref:GlxA family transcriptional regulator n=1 Tax=unclassified Roseibium TaxID=2629323 RepID=UPI00273D3113|nr:MULTISPECIES: GlxA family transcriptional regulator [unclassified Roseibium]